MLQLKKERDKDAQPTPGVNRPLLEVKASRKVVRDNEAEIKFDKGSDELSAVAKEKIDALVATALKKGKIDEIQVITWADQEFPDKEKASLSQNQRDLADARADRIEEYLKDEHGIFIGVKKFSMAKRANYLKRLFKTDEAKIKRELVDEGIPTTKEKQGSNSKASKAILVVLLKK